MKIEAKLVHPDAYIVVKIGNNSHKSMTPSEAEELYSALRVTLTECGQLPLPLPPIPPPLRSDPLSHNESTVFGFPAETILQLIAEARCQGRLR